MKIRLAMMLNTTTAILFSVACNGILFYYLLWSNFHPELAIVTSEENSTESFLEAKINFQSEYENQDTIDKFRFINATIEKNQKFNQELKTFISQSERGLSVSL